MRRRKKARKEPPFERVTVVFEDMAFEGGVLARIPEADSEAHVIFADYGIPGEEAVVEVEEERAGVLKGRVVDVIAASPHRITPACEYFGRCGGCQWQHI